MKDIKRFTSMESLQNLLVGIPLIETKVTGKVHRILSKTLAQNEMVGVIGMEGLGKSTAIAQYVLTNKNIYYVRMGESYNTKTLFHELIFILTAQEVYESTGLNNSINYLSSILLATPEKKLIIIDDAGKLKSKALGLFHELRDNTKSTTSFAFFGLQYFKDNLEKWSMEGKIGIAEFLRRFDFWYSLPKLTDQEKIEYLKIRDVQLSEKIRLVLNQVETIWELENRLKIILQRRSPI